MATHNFDMFAAPAIIIPYNIVSMRYNETCTKFVFTNQMANNKSRFKATFHSQYN